MPVRGADPADHREMTSGRAWPRWLRSEPIEQPRRAYRCRASRLDPNSQLPIGGDHGDLPPGTDLRTNGLDDRVVTGGRCVNRLHATFATGRCTIACGTFENQDDGVLWQ